MGEHIKRLNRELKFKGKIIDFYQDNLYIDVCISGDPCFLGILPNGQITQYRQGREMPTDLSAQTAPLVKILQQFPKQAQGLN